MKTKSFYEAPSSELLLVKFEEAFLQGTNNTPGNNYGDNDLGDLDDDDE